MDRPSLHNLTCGASKLSNEHRGNTRTAVKYAIHCATPEIHKKTLSILSKIGFELKGQETPYNVATEGSMLHTFLDPPTAFGIPPGMIRLVVVVHPDVNHQTINKTSNVQGPHLGLRVTLDTFKRVAADLTTEFCDITLIVEKPDESSMFIDLGCGEVLELVAPKS